MKKVIYYCDICGKEINDPSEDPCINVTIEQVHNWDVALPRAKLYTNLNICDKCGKEVIQSIYTKIEDYRTKKLTEMPL